MNKYDSILTAICEAFRSFLKWSLIIGGVILVVEQIVIFAINHL